MLASELKMKLVNLDQIFLFCQYVVMSNQAPMPRLISFFFFFTKGGAKSRQWARSYISSPFAWAHKPSALHCSDGNYYRNGMAGPAVIHCRKAKSRQFRVFKLNTSSRHNLAKQYKCRNRKCKNTKLRTLRGARQRKVNNDASFFRRKAAMFPARTEVTN